MIELTLSFHGEIADRMGRERRLALAAEAACVGEVRAELARRDEAASALLDPRIRAAVDAEVVDDAAPVRSGQQIMFFSVVSGG